MTFHRGCQFLFVKPLFLLYLISLCFAWDVSSPQDNSNQCAEIFFQGSFKGPSIQLMDEERISDLSDIRHHFNKEKISQVKTDEQQQNIISFYLQKGCKLYLSPFTYLRNDVNEFNEDVDAVTEFVPNSVFCECPKPCKCEDYKLRRSECARAYLGDDCTNCRAPFTTMRPGDGWKQFPEMWSSIVKSIVLKDGCTLSLKHAHEIQKLPENSRIFQDAQQIGNITSYHCNCTDAETAIQVSHGIKEHPNQNYPPLVNIPKSKGGINTLMFKDKLKRHPGLTAALQSLRNKRSSRNAYILLLGMTGSGKSSAVNLLFDHPNITKVGDFVSTTSDIHQFSIPVPVPELGMNNTSLHVIDTPGIGDTRGIAEDARFLASLEDFLNKNEDLRRNLPNVVLIFSKFSDNRYRGEGAAFVKMLRTIDLFRDRIIDKKATNVIFVLTHYMSETKDIIRNPSERIQSIRQVIQEYSTLPRPINIVLAENKPEESHLPSINGFYQLPNGELYPKNLFNQMQRVLQGDPVGEAVIRTGFSNSDNFQISGRTHRLLHRSNAKVTKYLGALASFNIPVSGTEVSTKLTESYEQVNSTVKANYPNAFETLQRTLYQRNIIQVSDLPQSHTETLRLFENIHINPITLFLLENAFNLTIPDFKGNYVVGSGYSLFSDKPLSSKIFNTDITTKQPSDLLFRLPDTYLVEMQHQLGDQFQVFTNMTDFIRGRMAALGLDNSIPLQEYNSSPFEHPGFNLISLSNAKETHTSNIDETPEITWNSLTATVNYQMFHISLNHAAKFTEEFSATLGQLETLNLTDPGNVENWRQFFDLYGTHVVTNAYGGGSIEVKVELINDHDSSSHLTNSEKFTLLNGVMANIMQELANELIGKDAIYSPPAGVKYEFFQRGGNHKYFWSNFSDLDDTKNIDEWKDSLKYQPVILTSHLLLVPISAIVKEIEGNQDLAFMIEEAASALLNASLLYLPKHVMGQYEYFESRDMVGSEAGYARGDYESMQEFATMFKTISETNRQMQENLIKLMKESQERQYQQEAQWQQEMLLLQQQEAENERKRREDDRFNREMQLKRDEMELQRIAQENALRAQIEQSRQQAEMQQRIMMEEIRAKNEQTMLSFINAENDRRAQIAMNKKGWLEKTFGFLQNAMSSMAQTAGTALMALGMG